MRAISRTLIFNPTLLILGEATDGLAPLVRFKIWLCLSRLIAKGSAILEIDKNVENLFRLADRNQIMEKGSTVKNSSTADLQTDATAVDRYLGV